MINDYGALQGKTVIVGGYGIAGVAASELALTFGAKVLVYDDSSNIAVNPLIERINTSPELLDAINNADLVIVSPGIPPSHLIFNRPEKVISELGFARGFIDTPILAVTGTNGKTTVTTLLSQMLERSGICNIAAGNIGIPLSRVARDEFEMFVVEASSFQLAYTRDMNATHAAFLNFAPDHLNWHGSEDNYFLSKLKVFDSLEELGRAYLPADDERIKAAVALDRSQQIFVPNSSTRIVGGELIIEGIVMAHVVDLHRKFRHDLTNFMFAGSMALNAGGTSAAVSDVIASFEGIEHRMQFLGNFDGHAIYNDSKATTPDAVICDLEGLGNLVLIAGGRNKGLDLSPLRVLVSKLSHVVAIGEAANEICDVFTDTSVHVSVAISMSSAVKLAFDNAKHNDAIVLSPGCTSWDWYQSYAQRGQDFADLTFELAKTIGSSVDKKGNLV